MLDSTKIIVNGDWVGVHRNPVALVRNLRELRRRNDVSPEVSVVYDVSEAEIRISTDQGRCQRPLLIVEDQNLLIIMSVIYG